MGLPVCHCSRCHSQNTIRVQEELVREHWYCYDCGRSFVVLIGDTERPDGTRRYSPAPSVQPKGRNDADPRSVRVR